MAGAGHGGDPADGAVAAERALAAVFREETARLTAALVRVVGDFAVAEEVVQDALLLAWEHWRADGIPSNPGGWLWTVARRRAVDLARRHARYAEKLALLAREPAVAADGDDRLALVFTCCHPALSHEAQVALTLRTVCGLSVEHIASAFLVPKTTIVQRLTRARRKIATAGIPFRVPEPERLGERLTAVLAVVYLTFNEGYLASHGEHPQRRDLAEDAEWLATLLAREMPAEPEVLGLLALIRLHRARERARFDAHGRLVLLADQDRSRWDRPAIAAAAELVVRASRMRRPGQYQLQAAIVACHTEAPAPEATDWPQILLLYNALLEHLPTPVVQLHRAVALAHVAGPEAALRELDTVATALQHYHLYHATRAHLLRRLGRTEDALLADRAALERTANPAEQALLEQRLGGDDSGRPQ
ncbi:MAG TPA: DUF6596 domain-containing protein [Amycolatopsis sp.]|nr:DUF6596 domain-containing protein [Amycolatopsis sp.]